MAQDPSLARPFAAAVATGPDWGQTAKACLDRLGPVAGANLGFLYISDALAGDATSIVTLLRGVTGIRDWVGTVGLGVCGTGQEFFDVPAIAVMAATLPPESFRLFAPVSGDLGRFHRDNDAWIARNGPALGLVHADPRHPATGRTIPALAATCGGFLVGGLTASRGPPAQFGGLAAEGPLAGKGVSGVLFSAALPVATGLTQGCSPIGPIRTITGCRDHVITEIDGRPALETFREDIGELLARDLRRVAGYIFVALPIPGSDTGDYLVRNLVAIDPQHGWIAIGEEVAEGQPLLFTRRDRQAAEKDLERMLAGLKKRIRTSSQGTAPRGAVYVSCVARGPNLFGEDSRELGMIRDALGDVPLAGFFANGEISHDRLYGYTGVLTVFL